MKQFSLSQAQPAARAARTAALGLALMAASGIAAAATSYDLMRFEDPRGPDTNFFPTGINNTMAVAGTASFQHGFKLTGLGSVGQPVSITVFDVPGAFNNFTFGDDINNSGVIVGSYRNGTGSHGFILDGAPGGAVTTIDVPGGVAGRTELTGLNDSGQVVGTYLDANSNTQGFVLTGASFTLLNAGVTQPSTLAQGINDAGRVVGFVGGGGTASRGFTFENSSYAFFDAPGAAWTQAYGINNAGVIVGAASTGLFVKDGATFATLDLPTSWHARNAVATDINDQGVVVGYFTDNTTNLTYGFLASPTAPVPEPGTWVLMLGGLLLPALAKRRRAQRAA